MRCFGLGICCLCLLVLCLVVYCDDFGGWFCCGGVGGLGSWVWVAMGWLCCLPICGLFLGGFALLFCGLGCLITCGCVCGCYMRLLVCFSIGLFL